jgi:archaemetzincin
MEAGIRVVPVGEVESQVLEHIRSALQEAFIRECRLGEGLPKPEYAYNPRRGQYSANEILQRLRLDGANRVLGVVDLDLYVPELNFVFGLADPFGGGAAIALSRLRQEFYGLPKDRILFLQRVVKEAVHELGHTYQLNHCADRRCVMAFSNSLADTDYKSPVFCEKCQSKQR